MILLDTCVLLQWQAGRLSTAAHRRMVNAATHEAPLWISAVSLFEVGNLARLGRLGRRATAALRAVESAPIHILDITADIARVAHDMPDQLRDPCDRLIVATAYALDCPLATTDRIIIETAFVKTV